MTIKTGSKDFFVDEVKPDIKNVIKTP